MYTLMTESTFVRALALAMIIKGHLGVLVTLSQGCGIPGSGGVSWSFGRGGGEERQDEDCGGEDYKVEYCGVEDPGVEDYGVEDCGDCVRWRLRGRGTNNATRASIARSRPDIYPQKDESSLFFFCRPHALDPPRHDADIPNKTSAYMNLQ